MSIRPGRAQIRTAFQLAAYIRPVRIADPGEILRDSRQIILDWIQGKFPVDLPPEAFAGEPFECDEHGQKLSAAPVPEEGVWAVRLEQPDAPLAGQAAVPGRTWTTDIALRRVENRLSFGVRVQCASLDYARDPITLTRPRVLVDLAARFPLVEARLINGLPWHLESFRALQDFEDFLLDPTRNMPAVLLTQTAREGAPAFLIDPEGLASHVQGFGYIATLPPHLEMHWSDLTGETWAAGRGAVRTYMPGLDYDEDTAAMHPLARPEKIRRWRHEDYRGDHTGPAAFQRFLVARLREHAANKRVNWRDCIFVPEARTLRAAYIRRQGEDGEAWRELYENEIEALREQAGEARDEAETAIALAENAEHERDYFREENARLRAYNESLRAILATQNLPEPAAERPLPSDYRELASWIGDRFVGRLELHPRAARALKKAEYNDIGRVCTALELLAGPYRDMRLGHNGANKRWEDGLMRQGLECSGSLRKHRAGEEGETYFVDYPPHSGSRQFLESHLKRGNAREAIHCLRVYFFWHEESQQVIVGWLPSHLDTRAT